MKMVTMQEVGGMRTPQTAADIDAYLIARIAQGDRAALTDLYVRYRLPLFRYVLQFTPDYGLAEEIVQDTLVAVWMSARSFEGRAQARTWLFGIARRQAHNTLRRRGLPLSAVTELDRMPADVPDPQDALLARVDRDDVTAALRRLTTIHREVLTLTFVHELSYAESAAILGVPVGTVKSRLSHAKRALRALFDAREEVE